jgi:hypothetical protein
MLVVKDIVASTLLSLGWLTLGEASTMSWEDPEAATEAHVGRNWDLLHSPQCDD